MFCIKASLIILVLIVPIVRSTQEAKEWTFKWGSGTSKNVQANLSMAELEASDANTKYWLRTQNTGRTIGSPCSEDKCVEACPEDWAEDGTNCYRGGGKKN